MQVLIKPRTPHSALPELALLICIWAAILVACSSQIKAEEPLYILRARGHPSAPITLTNYIARNATNRNREIFEGNTTIHAIASHVCGHVPKDDYLNVLQEINTGKFVKSGAGVVSKEKSAIILPACFWWSLGESIVTADRPNLTLYEIARQYIGFAGPITMSDLRKRNPSLTASSIPVGTRIRVPYRTKEISLEFQTRQDEITFLKGFSEVSVVDGIRDSGAFLPARGIPRLADPECPGVGPRYPFDAVSLKRILEATDRLTSNRDSSAFSKKKIRSSATVAVIDTGIQGFRDVVIHDRKWERPKEFPPSSMKFYTISIDDQVVYTFGQRLSGLPSWNPSAFDSDSIGYHGSHIAGLIRGGASISDAARDLITGRQKLVVMNIRDRQRLSDGSVDAQWATTAARLSTRKNIGAKVVNFSLEFFSDAVGNFGDLVERSPGVLFVAAAGNIGEAGVEVYPAAYSQKYRNVISVAAHDANGKILDLSARSRDKIDIAAPGCRLPSWVSEPGDGGDALTLRALSGTSQAAAHVSLAASLLISMGVPVNSIKERLFVSSDFISGLAVKSNGILNVPHSLAFHFDLVQLHGGDGPLELLGLAQGVSVDGREIDCGSSGMAICGLVTGEIAKLQQLEASLDHCRDNPGASSDAACFRMFGSRKGKVSLETVPKSRVALLFAEYESSGAYVARKIPISMIDKFLRSSNLEGRKEHLATIRRAGTRE